MLRKSINNYKAVNYAYNHLENNNNKNNEIWDPYTSTPYIKINEEDEDAELQAALQMSLEESLSTEQLLEKFRQDHLKVIAKKKKKTLKELNKKANRPQVIEPCPILYNVLTLFSPFVIGECQHCLITKAKQCFHLTSEELSIFWKLRAVSKVWKLTVETWLKKQHVVIYATYEASPRAMTLTYGRKSHARCRITESGVLAAGSSKYRQEYICPCLSLKYREAIKGIISKTLYGVDSNILIITEDPNIF